MRTTEPLSSKGSSNQLAFSSAKSAKSTHPIAMVAAEAVEYEVEAVVEAEDVAEVEVAEVAVEGDVETMLICPAYPGT